MYQFPSASAHRYNNLQNYLKTQYGLVLEVAAEAARLGYFAAPPQIEYEAYEDQHGGSSRPPIVHNVSTPTSTPAVPSMVKPSPSSPADLSLISARTPSSKPIIARPVTHFIPEREPRQTDPLRLRPTVTNITTAPMRYNQGQPDVEEYSPISPEESGVRPFSFAVRAGATGQGTGQGHQGSDGHGRRSFFGRWGGSVTSFFGGSQGGSGSMMDMQ